MAPKAALPIMLAGLGPPILGLTELPAAPPLGNVVSLIILLVAQRSGFTLTFKLFRQIRHRPLWRGVVLDGDEKVSDRPPAPIAALGVLSFLPPYILFVSSSLDCRRKRTRIRTTEFLGGLRRSAALGQQAHDEMQLGHEFASVLVPRLNLRYRRNTIIMSLPTACPWPCRQKLTALTAGRHISQPQLLGWLKYMPTFGN